MTKITVGRMYSNTEPVRLASSSCSGEFTFSVPKGTDMVICRENKNTWTVAYYSKHPYSKEGFLTTSRLRKKDENLLRSSSQR
jgi:hypothetical protein